MASLKLTSALFFLSSSYTLCWRHYYFFALSMSSISTNIISSSPPSLSWTCFLLVWLLATRLAFGAFRFLPYTVETFQRFVYAWTRFLETRSATIVVTRLFWPAISDLVEPERGRLTLLRSCKHRIAWHKKVSRAFHLRKSSYDLEDDYLTGHHYTGG